MATAGSIVVDLLMRTGSFFTDSKRAEKQLRDLEKAAYNFGRNIGSGVAQTVAGWGAAFLSIDAGVRAVGDAIKQADRLDELSAKLDISTEKLSGWAYAAKLSGTDLETLDKSLGKLSKTMSAALDPKSSAANLFKALGVDVVDAGGKLRDVEAVLPDLADKFAAIQNQTLKSALAMEVFGKSGTELLEFLSRGSAGINKLVEDAAKLGIIISPEQAAAAAAFNDKVDQLKGALTGFTTRLSAELLPNLDALLDKTLAFVRDGDRTAEIAHDIGNAFEFVAGTAKVFGTVLDVIGNKIEGISETLYGLNVAARGLFSFDWNRFSGGLGAARDGIMRQLAGPAPAAAPKAPSIPINFATPGGAAPANFFARSEAEVKARAGADALEKRLQAALATGAGGGKTGKTDAEKQAEKVEKAIREMTRAQRDWQTELDGTGNPILDAYNKRLDEITSKAEKFAADGVPTAKIDEFKKAMTGLAESIKTKELTEYKNEFSAATAAMAAQLDASLSPALAEYTERERELNKLLKEQKIDVTLYTERLTVLWDKRNEASIQFRRDTLFEIELLGKTREQQELLNAARHLGADASTEYGKAALDALAAYQSQRAVVDDQISAMDGLRDSARGFLHDLKAGENAWDALGNAVDRFADKLFDLAADNLIEQLFGQNGSSSGGSSGGSLSNLLGGFFGGGKSGGGGGGGWLSSLFGGGKSSAPSSAFGSLFGNNTGWLFGGAFAGGGQTMPDRAYLVGEHGPEMFVPRTAGAVLPADMTRTALGGGGRAPVIVNNSQHYNGLPGRQTMQQSQTDLALQLRRQAGRNR
ncbi:hypothetical protein [Lysobacter enzymogenes]|uniref:hypothetical protein n=1 Tax=Lysobacter enzymogenes TaxID=69 RepID=UPI000895A7E6|nr:hypothetical protein [Lysobacter enzymogenes]SDW95161.1 hypothetical protein SAMN05421681_103316 [Lysobacter enzymogenes]